MKIEEFIEKIKSPEGREEITKLMCDKTSWVEYQKTLESIQYLSLPILLLLDERGE